MVAGFNMLSFDLFGLGRKAQNENRDSLHDDKPIQRQSVDQGNADQDENPETDLFYLSLYPVF